MPTSVPIGGRSGITAAGVLAGAEWVLDFNLGFRFSVYSWVVITWGDEVFEGVDNAPRIGTGSYACVSGKAGEGVSPGPPAVANESIVEDPLGDVAGVSVAYVPQANDPATIAISGSANISDISGSFSAVMTELTYFVWV